MAAILLTVGLIALIFLIAHGQGLPVWTLPLREGDKVKVQTRAHVFMPAKVIRAWVQGGVEYAEVEDVRGERYIRAIELLERS